MAALELVRARVDWCEGAGVEFLVCPEGVLGGLADYASDPLVTAISRERGELDDILKPLTSHSVTTIIGFTEMSAEGQLYNAAAIFQRGAVVGVYRKRHPAIRTSIYQAGDQAPVFHVGGLTFGILICNDTELSRAGERHGCAGGDSPVRAVEHRPAPRSS